MVGTLRGVGVDVQGRHSLFELLDALLGLEEFRLRFNSHSDLILHSDIDVIHEKRMSQEITGSWSRHRIRSKHHLQ